MGFVELASDELAIVKGARIELTVPEGALVDVTPEKSCEHKVALGKIAPIELGPG